ncbi:hypothetical protein IKW72_07985 [bacterium]|nr:hypothetical protein [bacterium]
MIRSGEDIVWEEPQSFQELLRLRRLKRRSLWRNARPLVINTALIFSLIMIFFALYYRSDISKVFEPVKIISALAASFGISFIWRSLERRRRPIVSLKKKDGAYYLSRTGDYSNQPLSELKAYVVEELREGDFCSSVLIMKTERGQCLAALPDRETEKFMEGLMKELKIPKGKLKG